MIETFKDRTTGEIFQNQTVLCEFYVFWREEMLREQDKEPNIVCVMTGDWSGVQLENDAQRVRIEPIRFILPDGNEGRTLDDFLAAEVELPENITDYVDESQIEKVRRDAYTLYKYKVLDPAFLEMIPEPPLGLIHQKELNDIF